MINPANVACTANNEKIHNERILSEVFVELVVGVVVGVIVRSFARESVVGLNPLGAN